MARRLTQLFIGLVIYGLSMAALIRAGLGLDPWDVFHEGVANRTSLTFGTVVILTGALVLLLWIPLRQRPGIGTVANVLVIGLAADLGLWLIPEIDHLPSQILVMFSAIVINGIACGAYIGAGMGPGPRDGLMTGFCARTGWSVRMVRTIIEMVVLAAGWLLGGTVGVGTILYAFMIGPIIQVSLDRLGIATPSVAPGHLKHRTEGSPG